MIPWVVVSAAPLVSAATERLPLWAAQSLGRLPEEPGAAAITRSMMLGAGVLILTQIIVVGIAIWWFVSSQGNATPDSGETQRE